MPAPEQRYWRKRPSQPWWDSGLHTLFLGDFNFARADISKALEAASDRHGGGFGPVFLSGAEYDEYPTNISPDSDEWGDARLCPKCIDFIMEANSPADPVLQCKLLTADQLLPGLDDVVRILRCSGRSGGRLLALPSTGPHFWETEPA